MSPENTSPLQRHRTHTPTIKRIRLRGEYRWLVSGLYINRKRVRKYFPSREAADTYLENETTRIENLGRRAGAISGSLLEDALRAIDILRPHGTSLETAAKYFAAAETRKTKSKIVSEVISDFIANRTNNRRSKRHLMDLSSRLARFAKTYGNTLASEITTLEIDGWLLKLSKKYSPVSVVNFRRVIHNFFTFAVSRGFAPTNPVTAVELTSVETPPPGLFTPAELREILKAAESRILPAFAIGAFAGLRTAEIARLSWEDIKLSRGTIEVPASKSKTAQRRLVPIQPNLAAFLAPYMSHTGLVLDLSETQVRNLRAAAQRAAGFGRTGEETDEEKAAGIKLRKAPDNALRHSFASYRLAYTQDAAKTALELGHTTTTLLFSTYRELVSPEDAKAYWEIFPSKEISNVVSFAPAAA